MLPDENWAVRTLCDVENEDVNDRTYLFDAGPMDYQRDYCQAFYWHGEKRSKGQFNLCCGGGRLRHLRTASHPQSAFGGAGGNATASESTRAHSFTAYGFARMSTSMDKTQTGQRPRVFVAQGHVYQTTSRTHTTDHLHGAGTGLLHGRRRGRESTQSPHAGRRPDRTCLHETLEEHNPYTRFHRTVRETLLETPDEREQQLHLKFVTARCEAGSSATEDAAHSPRSALCSTTTTPAATGTWWCTAARKPRTRCSACNPISDHLDALLYPLLFPGGLAGWHAQLEVPTERRPKHKAVTPADFYAYRLTVRPDIDSSLLHHARKLFQQYLVDVHYSIDFLLVQFKRNGRWSCGRCSSTVSWTTCASWTGTAEARRRLPGPSDDRSSSRRRTRGRPETSANAT